MHGNAKDLRGQKFGRLAVISENGRYKHGQLLWLCKCDCGKDSTIASTSLVQGNQVSCGCLKNEKASLRWKTHGMRHFPEYHVWCGIKERCNNPKSNCYERYGGRGIKVCERWQSSFVSFFSDMGTRPSPTHTIERKNNAAGYSPDNCVWATSKEQAENRRSNIKLSFAGETKTIAQWAIDLGICAGTIYYRVHHGWTQEEALSIPVRPTGRL